MKLNSYTQNSNELDFENGVRILFSYKTPVCLIKDGTLYETQVKHSRTTSKHMSMYGCLMADKYTDRVKIPQAALDHLIDPSTIQHYT